MSSLTPGTLAENVPRLTGEAEPGPRSRQVLTSVVRMSFQFE
ncbi:Hypothetical protein AA314_03090 [Archangium gephyra]|uniref:Uncharacterized protein n=1 Tax=Archangium gephyra TaxID=48 RepID=A0AAC8Q678_9BACT|nr:Hypothetical protein AA314_03090 [Archangium gephyra]